MAQLPFRKVTLPDGFQVGILNLDNILKEVVELKLADTATIKRELLERVKKDNFVASGAEYDYSTALFHEYQRKIGLVKDVPQTEAKHPGG